tara:strand:+ start:47 stop:226 length:180 start_codon:yes stop_codon:yes gene_type:complete
MNNKLTNSNNAGNLIGILIAIVVAVSAWLFVNLSPWIASGFAISAALTWKIQKSQKDSE